MPSYFIGESELDAPPLEPGLYVVATPIGNLGDVTVRALQTLAAADAVACEDTRVTRRLLDRYGIHAEMIVYHEHNADRAGKAILERIGRGEAVAVASDAGTPLISDPGFRLVRAAREAGLDVWPVPGPSAAIAALSASGMESDRFLFEGFLPSRTQARRKRLAQLCANAETLIFYESPKRLAASLADMAAELGAERRLCVYREITKRFEEAVFGTAEELARQFADQPVRGEIVILAAPGASGEAMDPDRLLRELLQEMSVSAAAAEAARLTGLPKRQLYQAALRIGRSTD